MGRRSRWPNFITVAVGFVSVFVFVVDFRVNFSFVADVGFLPKAVCQGCRLCSITRPCPSPHCPQTHRSHHCVSNIPGTLPPGAFAHPSASAWNALPLNPTRFSTSLDSGLCPNVTSNPSPPLSTLLPSYFPSFLFFKVSLNHTFLAFIYNAYPTPSLEYLAEN